MIPALNRICSHVIACIDMTEVRMPYLPRQGGIAEAVTNLCSSFKPVKNETSTDLYPDERPRTVLKPFAHRETALENPLSLVDR